MRSTYHVHHGKDKSITVALAFKFNGKDREDLERLSADPVCYSVEALRKELELNGASSTVLQILANIVWVPEVMQLSSTGATNALLQAKKENLRIRNQSTGNRRRRKKNATTETGIRAGGGVECVDDSDQSTRPKRRRLLGSSES